MRILIDVDVPDLESAIAFYRDGLGLRLSRLLDDDVAELSGGSCTIYLLRKPAGSTATKAPGGGRDYARHWTPVHMDFVVEDLAAAERRVLDAGARRESERIEWQGSRCITFSDPFGNGFCLIEFDAGTYRDSAHQPTPKSGTSGA